jgi:hypothetical protein
MYEFLQIAVKVVLIFATMIVALMVSVRLWDSDLDLRTLVDSYRLIKRTRGRAGGALSDARVEGPVIDENMRVVRFEEIHTSNALDL